MIEPTPPAATRNGRPTPDHRADEFDRQRRRVLWGLPTGLYLIGVARGRGQSHDGESRGAGLPGAEARGGRSRAESVTAARRGRALHRAPRRGDKDVVRRFVKPVSEVVREPDGTVGRMTRA